MKPELKFLNDIIRPWDELNSLLAERYAFQPDLSAVTAQVTAISSAIKHQVDILAFEKGCKPRKLQKEVDAESDEARLVSDVSDAAKHIILDKPDRQNSIFVAAMFEVNLDGDFRFLRNGVFIEHVSLGCQDFMLASIAAIEYWVRKRGLLISWGGLVREGNAEFFTTAFLHFNSKFCINIDSTRIMCFSRDSMGSLIPFSPSEVRFEVR